METVEGNKLIAEFMGHKNVKIFNQSVGAREDDTATVKHGYYSIGYYHSSWDALMPVAQKILSTDTGTMDVYTLYVCDSLRTADISKVWESCIDFIQWHKNINP